MIGKLLQDEESYTEKDSGTGGFQTGEVPSADVLTIPESQPEVYTASEPAEKVSVFRETGDIIETVPLPENRESVTALSADAIISASSPVEAKKETYQETTAENMRRTGLAWTAATVLAGSVVFLLVIGWFFDLVFGSSPWGIVGGIVIGAIIGFVQFFRITSQIFKNDDNNSLGFK